jgi:hypothetical protein
MLGYWIMGVYSISYLYVMDFFGHLAAAATMTTTIIITTFIIICSQI